MSISPGHVRDSIINYLMMKNGDASLSEIGEAVLEDLGDVPQ